MLDQQFRRDAAEQRLGTGAQRRIDLLGGKLLISGAGQNQDGLDLRLGGG
ncbi:MAG TPA: hypothetical protein P5330_00960 [Candidatus Competibacteraceae bacterium]|nr:hypothetical protein [Candidatus Competibacteraceae bacterium]